MTDNQDPAAYKTKSKEMRDLDDREGGKEEVKSSTSQEGGKTEIDDNTEFWLPRLSYSWSNDDLYTNKSSGNNSMKNDSGYLGRNCATTELKEIERLNVVIQQKDNKLHQVWDIVNNLQMENTMLNREKEELMKNVYRLSNNAQNACNFDEAENNRQKSSSLFGFFKRTKGTDSRIKHNEDVINCLILDNKRLYEALFQEKNMLEKRIRNLQISNDDQHYMLSEEEVEHINMLQCKKCHLLINDLTEKGYEIDKLRLDLDLKQARMYRTECEICRALVNELTEKDYEIEELRFDLDLKQAQIESITGLIESDINLEDTPKNPLCAKVKRTKPGWDKEEVPE